MNKPIMFIDLDGRKIVPTNQFLASDYGKIYLKIMDNLKVMPIANTYLKAFIGANSTKDLYLSYSYLPLTCGTCSPLPTDNHKAVSKETEGRKNVTMFNSSGYFTPTSKIDLTDGTREGLYLSEMGMVAVVFHELIVHSASIPGISDATFMKNSKVMNALKKGILEYANANKKNLNEQEAASLAYYGVEDKDIDVSSDFYIANFGQNSIRFMKQIQDAASSKKDAPRDQTSDDRQAAQRVSDVNEKYLPERELKPKE